MTRKPRTQGYKARARAYCARRKGLALLARRAIHSALPARCHRCHGPGPLTPYSTTWHGRHRGPAKIIPAMLGGPAGVLWEASLIRSGDRALLCQACKPQPRPEEQYARQARLAIIAAMGGTCRRCGSTHRLALDRLDPPVFRNRATTPGERHKLGCMSKLIYYAHLTRSARTQVLCTPCNSHANAERPGWGEAVRRRALTYC